ncbi:MAG: hypothetical protein ACK48W_12550 [Bacteroidota bacterium]|jgi:hypothetical protein
MKKFITKNTIIFIILINSRIIAQEKDKKVFFNYYGHIEYQLNNQGNLTNSFFQLGEQDLFVFAKLTDRISFLGENVVRFDNKSPSFFIPSIERAQLKFDYFKNHSIVVGKIHTPTNYWNDRYHHGRLFFPTIERPLMFSYVVPLHTFGIRLQGNDIGRLKFGYNVVFGNGITSNDFSKSGSNLSSMVGVSIKPINKLQLSLTYYNDFIKDNISGVHSGHASAIHLSASKAYNRNINYQLISGSAAYFSNSLELLNEFSYNMTYSDSLGQSENWSNFLYLGYRIKDKFTPYTVLDIIEISNTELHVAQIDVNRTILGFRYDFSHLVNMKCQLALNNVLKFSNSAHVHQNSFSEFKIQLAYGF